MAYFEEKQKKLRRSWHDLAKQSESPYMVFMAEWIAFNANNQCTHNCNLCTPKYCSHAISTGSNSFPSRHVLRFFVLIFYAQENWA